MSSDPFIRRIRGLLGQGPRGLVPASPSSPTTKFLRGDGTWAVPSGSSGGITDHAGLSNLWWTASGHTATPRSLPWFSGSGAAATLGVGSTDRHFFGMSGLTPTWTALATIAMTGLYQDAIGRPTSWAAAGLTGTASSLAGFDGSANPTTYSISAALDLAGATQGSILIRTAAGWSLLLPGTAGQRLRTLGASVDLAWSDGPDVFGNGADGALDFDGSTAVLGVSPSSSTYVMTRDINATNIRVRSGVRVEMNGYELLGTGTLTFDDATGSITRNGNPASGGTGGSALTAGSGLGAVGQAGANGVSTNSNGSGTGNLSNALGGRGGAGGTSGGNPGGSAGTITTPTVGSGNWRDFGFFVGRRCRTLSAANLAVLNGGSGGGSGGANPGTGTATSGGGGAGATVCLVRVRYVSGAGLISANGGRGGNAAASGNGVAGGGGGGGGGYAVLITATPTPPCTVQAQGGSPGSGAGTTGVAGATGSPGYTATLIM